MKRAVFLTGTGTDVGKTYVAGLITKKLREAGLNAGYYKAAASGNRREGGRLAVGDCRFVGETASIPGDWDGMVSYAYEQAVSPHLAARLEGGPVELDRVKADFATALSRFDVVTVEGSGGAVCPLRWEEESKLMLTDVMRALRLSALVVSDAGLGAINAAVLTCKYLESEGIPVGGVILNRWNDGLLHRDNRTMIEQLAGVPVLATVGEGGELSASGGEALLWYGEV